MMAESKVRIGAVPARPHGDGAKRAIGELIEIRFGAFVEELSRRRSMLLIVLLLVLLLAVVPAWPHSRGWGYRPSGALGAVLLVVIVLVLLGRI